MILVANTQLFLEKFTINYLQNPLQSVLEFGMSRRFGIILIENLNLLLINCNEYVIKYEPALVSSKSLTKYVRN